MDIYLQWLGVPPGEQPPNYYRLLGINVYEHDVNVIRSAASLRGKQIQSVAAPDQTALVATLLEEIRRAERCLVDPVERAVYDARLAGRHPNSNLAPIAVGHPTAVPPPLPKGASLQDMVQPEPAEQNPSTFKTIAIAAAAFVVGGLGTAFVLSRTITPRQVAATTQSVPTAGPSTTAESTAVSAADTISKAPPVAEPVAATDVQPVRKVEEAGQPKGFDRSQPLHFVRSRAQEDYIPPPDGDWKRDWLAGVDVEKYATGPGWLWDPPALCSSLDGQGHLLHVPGQLPREFELELVVARDAGENELRLDLTGTNLDIQLTFDRQGARPGWYANLCVARVNRASAVADRLLPLGETRTLRLLVQQSKVALFDQDRKLVEHVLASDPQRSLRSKPEQRLPYGHGMTLSTRATAFRITRLAVRPAWSTPPATLEELADVKGSVDLLSAAVLPADAIRGTWQREAAGTLTNDETKSSVLQLRNTRFATYTLSFVAERVLGDGPLILGLWHGDRRMHLVLDGYPANQPPLFGLEMYDGKRLAQIHLVGRQAVFQDRRQHLVRCQLGAESLEVWIDGKPARSFPISAQNYGGVPPEWDWIETPDLYLATSHAQFRLRAIRLEDAGGELPPYAVRKKPAKRSQPDAAALAAALKTVRTRYGERMQAATDRGNIVEYMQWLRPVIAAPDLEPAEKFVLLRESIEIAVAWQMSGLALELLETMDKQFDGPNEELQRETLRSILRQADRTTAAQYVDTYLRFAKAALQRGRIVASGRFIGDAKALARRSGNAYAMRVSERAAQRHARFEINFAGMADRLERDPRQVAMPDPEDLAAWGLFLALGLGDFDAGVPLLQDVAEADLAPLVAQELAFPTSTPQILKLADGWWDYATGQQGQIQFVARQRAIHHYARLPHSELPAAEVERISDRRREQAAFESNLPIGQPIDVMQLMTTSWNYHKEPWVAANRKLTASFTDRGEQARSTGVKVDGDYDWKVRVKCSGGRDCRLALGLPAGEHRQLAFVIAGTHNAVCGLEPIDYARFDSNATTRKDVEFDSQKSHDILAQVRRHDDVVEVTITLDGAELLKWRGHKRFVIGSGSGNLTAGGLSLGVGRQDVTFEDLELVVHAGGVTER